MLYICPAVIKPYGINTMKTFKFIGETKYTNPNDTWYYTTENDGFVPDSGHFDKAKAYEKFMVLSQGGSIKPKVEIFEEVILEPNK